METVENNNKDDRRIQDATTIEYSHFVTDSDDTESNKSTPYYTPLEYLQSSFEFPSPNTETTTHLDKKEDEGDDTIKIDISHAAAKNIDEPELDVEGSSKVHTPKSFTVVTPRQMLNFSPAMNRKFKRFSLYERRSCSPQHLSIRNAAPIEEIVDTEKIVDDKENTKPKYIDKYEESMTYLTNSGNNSPNPLMIEETGSPKIITANDAVRLAYSPKLLASINNLNLTGSPLGVINSAGYKNGNYFKFPEIDHVVQDCMRLESNQMEDVKSQCDNNQTIRLRQKHLSNRIESTSPTLLPSSHQQTSRFKPINCDIEMEKNPPYIDTQNMKTAEPTTTSDDGKPTMEATKCRENSRKNRKNKNNLTIRISDAPNRAQQQAQGSPSPSPKVKTPTIRTTKEKARSLDSAAGESELSIAVQNMTDELNIQEPKHISSAQLIYRKQQEMAATTTISTSLSQLDSNNLNVNATCMHRAISRRRMPGLNSGEWIMYHRKQNPFNMQQNLKLDVANAKIDTELSAANQHKDMELKDKDIIQTISNTVGSHGATLMPTGASGSRGIHKHNPLLHSSNTNLKTLPEFLTLVEFSTATSSSPEKSPFKQKSMDLPVCGTQSHLPEMRVRGLASTSSMNLLQRRGSNHSLTLNLHSSCGNLINSGGLSVSNYSLGSVGNFSTILNSKSSCNLELNANQNAHTQLPQHCKLAASGAVGTQGSRQSLFRRRGSNHSLTLNNLTATSCGDLNAFASQNSLNISSGVTRTTSFITTTHNTASNAATPKRGLLERRGSNQSLTLNMSNILGASNQHLSNDASNLVKDDSLSKLNMPLASNMACCSCAQSHQRKFFSTENLNTSKSSQQFQEVNQAAHKTNHKQVSYGSESDLKSNITEPASINKEGQFDFAEGTTACTCTCTGGIRNIMTRPLSPHTTSEEFKIYLAGIQMLQSASNALNQMDLIKLNFIFDNSYKTNNALIEQPPVLNIHNSRDNETPNGHHSTITITSEDTELLDLYQSVVKNALQLTQPDDAEQKRIFRELHKEFWDLPLNHQEKPMVFGSQTKNRYKTILPNEHSRVILDNETKEFCSDLSEVKIGEDAAKKTNVMLKSMQLLANEVPYINANYIKGPDYVSKCYVATQGPLPNTIFEFWLMIYQNTLRYIQMSTENTTSPHYEKQNFLQQYYQKIVMLTNFLENNRQKCSIYFPVELNEIFAVAGKQEVIQLAEPLKQFFGIYLTADTANDLQLNCIGDENDEHNRDMYHHINIQQFSVELTDDCRKLLPAAITNLFLIKNVGIVRRNGFSIRKLVILYCINAPTSDKSNEFVVRKFYCYHYWYPDWPDHRSPRDINTLLDTCLHVLNLGKCETEFDTYDEHDDDDSMTMGRTQNMASEKIELYQQDIFNAVQPLPVIHCSAGIGRTGCFTAILNAIRQFRQSLAYSITAMTTAICPKFVAEEMAQTYAYRRGDNDTDSSFTRNTLLYIKYILKTPNNKQLSANDSNVDGSTEIQLPTFDKLPKIPEIYVDILGIVCNLRLQRGGMVQNSEQYELIHRAVCLYLKRTFALRRF